MSQIDSKKKAVFRRKYQDFYQNYRFIAVGDTHAPHQLCIICSEQLTNEAMKPTKLLRHIQTKHPALNFKPLQLFERKNINLKDKSTY